MRNKPILFHEWLLSEGYTIQKFANLIGQGHATVASWRTKSSHGKSIKLKSASESNILRIFPTCPLVVKNEK